MQTNRLSSFIEGNCRDTSQLGESLGTMVFEATMKKHGGGGSDEGRELL
jgi:hypothetical protein